MNTHQQEQAFVAVCAGMVAATYGLVRQSYGLLLPEMTGDLDVSVGVAGTVASAASLAYAAAAAVAFVLSGRHPRLLVALAGLTGAAGSVGLAVAADPASFALSATVASVAAGLTSPALVALLRRNLSPEREPSAQFAVNAANGPGLVAAVALAFVVLPHWRAAWWVVAAVTTVVTVGVLLADRVRSEPDGPRAALPWRRYPRPAAAAVLAGVGSAAAWVFGRTLLTQDGAMTATPSVLCWAGIGVGGALAVGTSRRVSSLPVRRAWTLSVTAMAAGTLLLAAFPSTPLAAAPAATCFGWGFGAGTSVLILWARSVDPASVQQGTALLFVALVGGQAVGSALVGSVAGATSARLAFVVAAVLTLAALVPALAGVRGTGDAVSRSRAAAPSPAPHPEQPAPHATGASRCR